MRILVVGDLHGEIKKLKTKIPKAKFDFIVGLGDYSGIKEWYSYVKYYLKLKKGAKRKTAVEFFGKTLLLSLLFYR